MSKELFKERFIKICMFMTKPMVAIVSFLIIILLYKYAPGIGFFALVFLTIAIVTRLYHSASFAMYRQEPPSGYSTPSSSTSLINSPSHKVKKKEVKPIVLDNTNHEKIDDKYELDKVNEKFNEIASKYD